MADNISVRAWNRNATERASDFSLFYSILDTASLLLTGMVDRHKVFGLGLKYLAVRQYFPFFHSSEPPLTQHEHRQGLKELHDCTSQQ